MLNTADAKHGRCASAGASVGLILISSVSWGSSIFECDTLRVVRPMQLAFPAYEDDVLTKVICFCMYATDSAASCCCIEHAVRVGLFTCIKMNYTWQQTEQWLVTVLHVYRRHVDKASRMAAAVTKPAVLSADYSAGLST